MTRYAGVVFLFLFSIAILINSLIFALPSNQLKFTTLIPTKSEKEINKTPTRPLGHALHVEDVGKLTNILDDLIHMNNNQQGIIFSLRNLENETCFNSSLPCAFRLTTPYNINTNGIIIRSTGSISSLRCNMGSKTTDHRRQLRPQQDCQVSEFNAYSSNCIRPQEDNPWGWTFNTTHLESKISLTTENITTPSNVIISKYSISFSPLFNNDIQQNNNEIFMQCDIVVEKDSFYMPYFTINLFKQDDDGDPTIMTTATHNIPFISRPPIYNIKYNEELCFNSHSPVCKLYYIAQLPSINLTISKPHDEYHIYNFTKLNEDFTTTYNTQYFDVFIPNNIFHRSLSRPKLVDIIWHSPQQLFSLASFNNGGIHSLSQRDDKTQKFEPIGVYTQIWYKHLNFTQAFDNVNNTGLLAEVNRSTQQQQQQSTIPITFHSLHNNINNIVTFYPSVTLQHPIRPNNINDESVNTNNNNNYYYDLRYTQPFITSFNTTICSNPYTPICPLKITTLYAGPRTDFVIDQYPLTYSHTSGINNQLDGNLNIDQIICENNLFYITKRESRIWHVGLLNNLHNVWIDWVTNNNDNTTINNDVKQKQNLQNELLLNTKVCYVYLRLPLQFDYSTYLKGRVMASHLRSSLSAVIHRENNYALIDHQEDEIQQEQHQQQQQSFALSLVPYDWGISRYAVHYFYKQLVHYTPNIIRANSNVINQTTISQLYNKNQHYQQSQQTMNILNTKLNQNKQQQQQQQLFQTLDPYPYLSGDDKIPRFEHLPFFIHVDDICSDLSSPHCTIFLIVPHLLFLPSSSGQHPTTTTIEQKQTTEEYPQFDIEYDYLRQFSMILPEMRRALVGTLPVGTFLNVTTNNPYLNITSTALTFYNLTEQGHAVRSEVNLLPIIQQETSTDTNDSQQDGDDDEEDNNNNTNNNNIVYNRTTGIGPRGEIVWLNRGVLNLTFEHYSPSCNSFEGNNNNSHQSSTTLNKTDSKMEKFKQWFLPKQVLGSTSTSSSTSTTTGPYGVTKMQEKMNNLIDKLYDKDLLPNYYYYSSNPISSSSPIIGNDIIQDNEGGGIMNSNQTNNNNKILRSTVNEYNDLIIRIDYRVAISFRDKDNKKQQQERKPLTKDDDDSNNIDNDNNIQQQNNNTNIGTTIPTPTNPTINTALIVNELTDDTITDIGLFATNSSLTKLVIETLRQEPNSVINYPLSHKQIILLTYNNLTPQNGPFVLWKPIDDYNVIKYYPLLAHIVDENECQHSNKIYCYIYIQRLIDCQDNKDGLVDNIDDYQVTDFTLQIPIRAIIGIDLQHSSKNIEKVIINVIDGDDENIILYNDHNDDDDQRNNILSPLQYHKMTGNELKRYMNAKYNIKIYLKMDSSSSTTTDQNDDDISYEDSTNTDQLPHQLQYADIRLAFIKRPRSLPSSIKQQSELLNTTSSIISTLNMNNNDEYPLRIRQISLRNGSVRNYPAYYLPMVSIFHTDVIPEYSSDCNITSNPYCTLLVRIYTNYFYPGHIILRILSSHLPTMFRQAVFLYAIGIKDIPFEDTGNYIITQYDFDTGYIIIKVPTIDELKQIKKQRRQEKEKENGKEENENQKGEGEEDDHDNDIDPYLSTTKPIQIDTENYDHIALYFQLIKYNTNKNNNKNNIRSSLPLYTTKEILHNINYTDPLTLNFLFSPSSLSTSTRQNNIKKDNNTLLLPSSPNIQSKPTNNNIIIPLYLRFQWPRIVYTPIIIHGDSDCATPTRVGVQCTLLFEFNFDQQYPIQSFISNLTIEHIKQHYILNHFWNFLLNDDFQSICPSTTNTMTSSKMMKDNKDNNGNINNNTYNNNIPQRNDKREKFLRTIEKDVEFINYDKKFFSSSSSQSPQNNNNNNNNNSNNSTNKKEQQQQQQQQYRPGQQQQGDNVLYRDNNNNDKLSELLNFSLQRHLQNISFSSSANNPTFYQRRNAKFNFNRLDKKLNNIHNNNLNNNHYDKNNLNNKKGAYGFGNIPDDILGSRHSRYILDFETKELILTGEILHVDLIETIIGTYTMTFSFCSSHQEEDNENSNNGLNNNNIKNKKKNYKNNKKYSSSSSVTELPFSIFTQKIKPTTPLTSSDLNNNGNEMDNTDIYNNGDDGDDEDYIDDNDEMQQQQKDQLNPINIIIKIDKKYRHIKSRGIFRFDLPLSLFSPSSLSIEEELVYDKNGDIILRNDTTNNNTNAQIQTYATRAILTYGITIPAVINHEIKQQILLTKQQYNNNNKNDTSFSIIKHNDDNDKNNIEYPYYSYSLPIHGSIINNNSTIKDIEAATTNIITPTSTSTMLKSILLINDRNNINKNIYSNNNIETSSNSFNNILYNTTLLNTHKKPIINKKQELILTKHVQQILNISSTRQIETLKTIYFQQDEMVIPIMSLGNIMSITPEVVRVYKPTYNVSITYQFYIEGIKKIIIDNYFKPPPLNKNKNSKNNNNNHDNNDDDDIIICWAPYQVEVDDDDNDNDNNDIMDNEKHFDWMMLFTQQQQSDNINNQSENKNKLIKKTKTKIKPKPFGYIIQNHSTQKSSILYITDKDYKKDSYCIININITAYYPTSWYDVRHSIYFNDEVDKDGNSLAEAFYSYGSYPRYTHQSGIQPIN